MGRYALDISIAQLGNTRIGKSNDKVFYFLNGPQRVLFSSGRADQCNGIVCSLLDTVFVMFGQEFTQRGKLGGGRLHRFGCLTFPGNLNGGISTDRVRRVCVRSIFPDAVNQNMIQQFSCVVFVKCSDLLFQRVGEKVVVAVFFVHVVTAVQLFILGLLFFACLAAVVLLLRDKNRILGGILMGRYALDISIAHLSNARIGKSNDKVFRFRNRYQRIVFKAIGADQRNSGVFSLLESIFCVFIQEFAQSGKFGSGRLRSKVRHNRIASFGRFGADSSVVRIGGDWLFIWPVNHLFVKRGGSFTIAFQHFINRIGKCFGTATILDF